KQSVREFVHMPDVSSKIPLDPLTLVEEFRECLAELVWYVSTRARNGAIRHSWDLPSSEEASALRLDHFAGPNRRSAGKRLLTMQVAALGSRTIMFSRKGCDPPAAADGAPRRSEPIALYRSLASP